MRLIDPSLKYELVIFDMDGTVLDTLTDLYEAMNYALRAVSAPEKSPEEVRLAFGNGAEHAVRVCLAGKGDSYGEDTFEKALAAFKDYYLQHCNDHTRPYEGIPALISRLREKGIKTAIVSNKLDQAVQELADLHFPGAFDAYAGERPGIRRKPAPDTVDAVMRVLQADRTRTVYVGDSEVDLETAKNAGIPSVIVSWGFRARAFLERLGADPIVDTEDELFRALIL